MSFNKTVRRRFIPLLDQLEHRNLLAGNVTSSVAHGALELFGDAEANQISVVANPDHSVTVTALDATTTIDGSSSPVTFHNIKKGIGINLKEGDDVLQVTGVQLKRGLNIDMGAGADTLTISGVKAGKTSGIGVGADDDITTITDSTFSNLQFQGGEGDDRMNASNLTTSRNTVIDGGAGTNDFGGTGNHLRHTALINWQVSTGLLPTAVDDTATTIKSGNVTINVASNDTTPSGTIDLTSIVIITQPTHGAVVVNNDGTVKYTNDGNAATSDSFQYTIKNSGGGVTNVATVTLTIDQGPTAVNDTANVAQGGNVTVPVSTNDTVTNGTLNLASIVITTQPTHGAVVVNADGTVKYTHDNSASTSDTFAYSIKDSLGAVSNAATVAITIAAGPVATNDSATVIKSGNNTINVASNDTTPTGTLNLASIVITTQPAHGAVVVNNDGTVKYTHNGDTAIADSFAYTIKNNTGGLSNIATVALTIDQGPTAVNDTANVAQGGNVTIPVSSNDTVTNGTLDLTSIVITTPASHGTVVVNADGSVKYTHDNTATTSDSFAYTIKDSLGAVSNSGTVAVTIA